MSDAGDFGDVGDVGDVDGDAGDAGGQITSELPAMNLVKAPEKTKMKINSLHDRKTEKIKESHETVQIRKTIYSAAALDTTFWPTAFLTFCLQVVVIILYIYQDCRPFKKANLDEKGWDLFSLALGRFVAYFLIWTNSVADLQNAMNLLFCTHGSDRILGGFQLIIVLACPFAFVCVIQSSENFKEALTFTGILAMFIKLDEIVSSVLDLGLLKREIGELVHTIENPFPPGVRELIMNGALMTYTCATFFYVWYIALDMYPVAVILWIGFTLFFSRAFYLDMKSSEEVILNSDLGRSLKSLLGNDHDDEDHKVKEGAKMASNDNDDVSQKTPENPRGASL